MRRTLLGLAVFLACFAAAGVSQIDTGLISGTVTDTTGAVVANATVSAEAIQTGSIRKTVTNQNGFYTISTLQPGEYEVSAETSGFATFHQRLEVTVGSRSTLNAVWVVRGGHSEMTVIGEGGVQGETQTQTVAEVVDGKQITQLQTLTRNPYDNNARGIERGHFTRNQFGYSLGGPIIKNRLFFFQSTEWTRIRSHQTSVALVPTPEFLAQTAASTQAYFAAFDGGGATMNGPVFTKADLLAEGLSPVPGGSFDRLPPETPVLVQSAFQTFADAGGGST